MMRAFEKRRLTTGEIALARTVFAEHIDYPRVTIRYAPLMPYGAIVPIGDTILHGAAWPPPRDFTCDTLDRQGWFIHEMAHVWQAEIGVTLALAKLRALGASAYRVVIDPALSFFDYNIEQQAEIARFVFLAQRGCPHPDGPPRRTLETLWPIRAGDLLWR
jgi:hypothetical protein